MRMMKILLGLFCLLITANSTFRSKLLYANRKDVRLLWTTTKGVIIDRVVVSTLDEGAVAVDYLFADQTMFWADDSEEKIYSCSLKSVCQPQVIVSGDLGKPEGLAVDWITRKLYWTDYRLKQISVSSLDGKQRKTLIWNDIGIPRAIALDPSKGLMFWSDWGDYPKISRASMDGSNKTDLVTTFISWPNGLTLDYQQNRVYWLDAAHNYIATVDYYGKDRRMTYTQVGTMHHPYALTISSSELYWTDWDTNSIRKYDISAKTVSVLKTNIYSPMDIKVYGAQRQNVSLNPCGKDNGGCSHLCLLTPGSYSCACSSGVALMANNKTCQNGPQKFLLLTKQTEIRLLSLSTKEHKDFQLPINNIGHVVAVDFDFVEKMTCWIDSHSQEINCARLNGSDVRTIVHLGNSSSAEGLAIDWLARSLYWTDTRTGSVEMCSLNANAREVIVSQDLDEPRAIAVDPHERFVYWTDWGAHPKLERAKLNGTKREILINTSIVWPNGLVLDRERQKLYWADAKLDKIEMCDTTGTHRLVITRVGVPHIFSFTLVRDYLYWSDMKTRKLVRMKKQNSDVKEIIMEFVPNGMSIVGVDLEEKCDL